MLRRVDNEYYVNHEMSGGVTRVYRGLNRVVHGN